MPALFVAFAVHFRPSLIGKPRSLNSLAAPNATALRTAVSLIGFGFAIVQFFNHLSQIPGDNQAHFPQAPYYLGLGLIACGVLATVVAIWQYEWTLRYLWHGSFAAIAGMTKEGLQTPVLAVTILLLLTGVFAFFAVLLHFV